MCIIIAKEKGKKYNEQELIDAIEVAKIHNSDGAGFAFKKGNSETILISKGFLFYYEIMLERLAELDIQPEDELIVHLRYATSGNIDAENCHPFVVSSVPSILKETEAEVKEPVLAHNGTFYEYSYTNSEDSDTIHFIRELASKEGVLESLATLNKSIPFKMEDFLGSNRICVIFPGDKSMLRMGEWNRLDNGDFEYSNFYHKYPDSTRAYGGKSPHTKSNYHNYNNYKLDYWNHKTY